MAHSVVVDVVSVPAPNKFFAEKKRRKQQLVSQEDGIAG